MPIQRARVSVDDTASRAHRAALINVVVWVKTNGGQGSLWRSQHELLPVFKKGAEPHISNVELGRHGRWRSNVWNTPGRRASGRTRARASRSTQQ
jgi:hypothetical protein